MNLTAPATRAEKLREYRERLQGEGLMPPSATATEQTAATRPKDADSGAHDEKTGKHVLTPVSRRLAHGACGRALTRSARRRTQQERLAQLRYEIDDLHQRVRVMPGRVICQHCLGHNVGADVLQTLWHWLKSAVCWHLEDDGAPVPFVSRVSRRRAHMWRAAERGRERARTNHAECKHPLPLVQLHRRNRHVQVKDRPSFAASSAADAPADVGAAGAMPVAGRHDSADEAVGVPDANP
jgi:hypothetical protein